MLYDLFYAQPGKAHKDAACASGPRRPNILTVQADSYKVPSRSADRDQDQLENEPTPLHVPHPLSPNNVWMEAKKDASSGKESLKTNLGRMKRFG
jgi:hypothetical protein